MSAPEPDALVRQAIAHHQAGRLAEAEMLYRQVLAARPGFAEVHVNLGVVLMFRGQLAAAEVACRAGLALKPDYAKGHNYLGDILAFQGRHGEAAEAFGHALARKPDYAEAQNSLGNALMQQGEWEAALAAFHRALALRPDFSGSHNMIGHILLQQDKPAEAEAAFRRALAASPGSVEALSNLGAALGNQGRLDEAAECCRRAIAARPGHAEAHNNLGNVLKEQGHLGEAEACYRRALSLKPGFAEAHKQLGVVLCQQDRIAEGFAALTAHAELAYGPGAMLRPGSQAAHKLRHDREQRDYLGSGGDGHLHLADGGRIAGPAVNRQTDIAGVLRQWQAARPQLVVIDNLLTPEALEKLRRFTLGSTIWRAVYEGGYLGAMPEHGFASPLLAQIGEELRAAYPAIFGGQPLLHCWAFKYDSRLKGIKLHADFAAVNVNFWITPDEANLEPDSGGLVVWDKAAPLDWDFLKYNTAEAEIRDFLAAERARAITVPYRANRAVIFDSDLFHETDRIAFREGYENRRINITLLYGRRETDRKSQ